jgi:hypothetical protein
MGNIASEAALGSNHTSRAPDQEFWPGEGFWFGLNASAHFSGNFTEAPYTVAATGTHLLPQRFQMPFALINTPSIQILGLSPALMEVIPNWLWSDNAYAPKRNEGKYARRDRAKRHKLGRGDLERYPYETLRPSIINRMILARNALRDVDTNAATVARIGDAEIRYYTERQISGIGKNFLLEKKRKKAVDSYTEMIRYYALKGLKAEVQKMVDQGQAGQVATLLATPFSDLRWEHERRVLLTEMTSDERLVLAKNPIATVASLLGEFADMEEKLAERVLASKEKDDKRGLRIIPGYDQAHTKAEDEEFVKDTKEGAKRLRERVNEIIPMLQQAAAGLEEPAEVIVKPAEPVGSAAQLSRSLQEAFRGIQPVAVSPQGGGVIVDLTVDENGQPNPAAALAVPYLPEGVVAIVNSFDDLLTAWKITDQTTQAKIVGLDQVQGDFGSAFRCAIGFFQPGSAVQIVSGRPEVQIQSIRDGLGETAVSLQIVAPKTLAQILEIAGLGEKTRAAIITQVQRAQENWDGVAKYL